MQEAIRHISEFRNNHNFQKFVGMERNMQLYKLSGVPAGLFSLIQISRSTVLRKTVPELKKLLQDMHQFRSTAAHHFLKNHSARHKLKILRLHIFPMQDWQESGLQTALMC